MNKTSRNGSMNGISHESNGEVKDSGKRFMEIHKNAMDSAKALAQLAFDNTQCITEINFEFIQELITDAQEKARKIMQATDHPVLLEYFQDESPTATLAQVVAHQAKVAEVLRKNNEVFIAMANDAIEKTQSEFSKLASEAIAKAPTSSEAFMTAFTAAFDAGLQRFAADRIAKQNAYANLQRMVDQTFSSAVSKLIASSQSASKSHNGASA